MKVYLWVAQQGVLILGLLHDLQKFDLGMGDVDFRSLAEAIQACCTYHERSMKVVELAHSEALLGVP